LILIVEQRFARLNVAFENPSGKAEFLIADAGDPPLEKGRFMAQFR
jgi:hypothetical protein